ncbi:MAG: hypothetical protein HQL93_11120 [Magnetococcales bacterium]|nr:hypothetical protein [Magnetococcales bacterium]
MISVSYPVLLHLYRRMDRARPIKQFVEPGAGVQGQLSATRPGMVSQDSREVETNDFQTFFLKALEKQQ